MPGSATATADTAVKRGRTNKARLRNFIVNGIYDVGFGTVLFWILNLFLSLI